MCIEGEIVGANVNISEKHKGVAVLDELRPYGYVRMDVSNDGLRRWFQG